MRGIILAGGSGTRLFPVTRSVSKQLLPVYDKPAIYYPLSTLMLADIREILVISTERDTPLIQGLLGDGSQWGIQLSYQVQARPEGIAQAFVLGDQFLNRQPSCLVLGDNLFYGQQLDEMLRRCRQLTDGARVLAYRVQNPENFGVVLMDSDGRALQIEEKPKIHLSNWAVTGIYFYDGSAAERAKRLKPSPRGELEITDLNRTYLHEQKLSVERLSRGVAWLDMGTPDSLLTSGQFVQVIEQRQGLKIACLEEIALMKGYINSVEFDRLIARYPESSYRQYLQRLAQNPDLIVARIAN